MARRSLRATDIAWQETFSKKGAEDESRWAKIINALLESEELGDLECQEGKEIENPLVQTEKPYYLKQ